MRSNKTIRNLMQQTIFIGPALFFFTCMVLIPFCMGMVYAFTRWDGVSSNVVFNGITNFKTIFSDEIFIKSFWFTSKFAATAVILANLLAFVLAMMLTVALKLKNVYRAIFFIPNVISGFILGFIWQFIFVRVFAAIGELTNIGFFQLPWLGTAATGFWATVMVQLWQLSGYLMVIYIAGLTSVPKDLVESTMIDGANWRQTLRHLTIPMIMPSISVCLFLSISSTFKLFDLNYSLTRGNFDTRSMALDVYNEAFLSNNYGLGTAKALVFCIIVATFTIIQAIYTKKKEVVA